MLASSMVPQRHIIQNEQNKKAARVESPRWGSIRWRLGRHGAFAL